jgi:hypothetical protein
MNNVTKYQIPSQESLKKQKGRMEEKNKRDYYVHGGSHTCVFSIGQECL